MIPVNTWRKKKDNDPAQKEQGAEAKTGVKK